MAFVPPGTPDISPPFQRWDTRHDDTASPGRDERDSERNATTRARRPRDARPVRGRRWCACGERVDGSEWRVDSRQIEEFKECKGSTQLGACPDRKMGTPARLYSCMSHSETAEGGHPTDEDLRSKMSKVAKMSKMLGTAARLHVVCLGFKDGQECPSYGRRFFW